MDKLKLSVVMTLAFFPFSTNSRRKVIDNFPCVANKNVAAYPGKKFPFNPFVEFSYRSSITLHFAGVGVVH